MALQEAAILRKNISSTLGSVNRAYYAMFYAVLALLQQKGKVPRKHAGAIALFDAEFVRKGILPKKLSAHLHQAFASRQESDYHAIEPVSLQEVDEIIQRASDFVQTAETYLRGAFNGKESEDEQ